ncbi:hypothetical protein G6F43_000160 [Rhizopus delemar]|nr:hypothetical protein G6F43_000160 [Rhizopus delemar]
MAAAGSPTPTAFVYGIGWNPVLHPQLEMLVNIVHSTTTHTYFLAYRRKVRSNITLGMRQRIGLQLEPYLQVTGTKIYNAYALSVHMNLGNHLRRTGSLYGRNLEVIAHVLLAYDRSYTFSHNNIDYDAKAHPIAHFKAFYRPSQDFAALNLPIFNCFSLHRSWSPCYATIDIKILCRNILYQEAVQTHKTTVRQALSYSEHTDVLQAHYVSTPTNHIAVFPIHPTTQLSSYFKGQLAWHFLITNLRRRFGDDAAFAMRNWSFPNSRFHKSIRCLPASRCLHIVRLPRENGQIPERFRHNVPQRPRRPGEPTDNLQNQRPASCPRSQ